jgi:hypothetical protein
MLKGLGVFGISGPGLLLLSALTVPGAFADTTAVFDLNVDGSGGSLGVGSSTVGTVTIDDNGAGTLDFTVALLKVSGTQVYFQTDSSGDQHSSFAYNLNNITLSAGSPSVSSPGSWTAVAPAEDQSFGQFTNGIDCALDGTKSAEGAKVCTDGAKNGLTSLSFTISGTGLSLGSFTDSTKPGGGGALFAADISINGNTGADGATVETSCTGPGCKVVNTPEASTVEFLASDFGLIALAGAFFVRRRRGVLARS